MEDWLGTSNPEFLNDVVEPIFSALCGWKPSEMSKGRFACTTTAFTKSEGVTCAAGWAASPRSSRPSWTSALSSTA